jgi:hypothetical protein
MCDTYVVLLSIEFKKKKDLSTFSKKKYESLSSRPIGPCRSLLIGLGLVGWALAGRPTLRPFIYFGPLDQGRPGRPL